MKWVDGYNNKSKEPKETSEVVSTIIEERAQDYNWEESVHVRLDKLIEIVGVMADLLPVGKQRELMTRIAYGWAPSNE